MIGDELRRLHEEGWSLVPVGSDKKALISWKPYQETRATLEQVLRWDDDLNPAVWAGATGEVSGRIALDFDAPDGPGTMQKLGLSPHRATPNGGFHVDVAYPGWPVTTVSAKTKKALGNRFPGLDVRGGGGYINLTGSTATGSYKWLRDDWDPLPVNELHTDLREAVGLLHPPEVPAAHPPVKAAAVTVVLAPVREQMEPEADRFEAAAFALMDRALERAPADGRNNAGFWLACQLRDEGFSLPDASAVMHVYAERTPAVNAKGVTEAYTAQDAMASLDQAWRHPKRSSWRQLGSPVIEVTDRQLRDLSADAVVAIVADNNPPYLFVRGSAATRIMRDEAGRPRTDVLKADSMKHVLSQVATWVRPSNDDPPRPPKNAHPPVEVAKDLLVRQWGELPTLTALVEAPCLRPDGTLLTQPGWDEATGLWLDPHRKLEVPHVLDNPSDADIAAALHLLQDQLLAEFEFVDAASKANALALILTTALRPAIGGLIPMALINAPVAGTGKTLLASIAARIATGRPAGLTSAPTGDDEELRKRLTALLIAGQSLVVFDNVASTLSSHVLAQALTSDVWTDRVLGASKVVDLPQRAVWVATGNNLQLGGDLARRCYPILLDPKTAQPWRRHFRRPDLDSWVLDNRGQLLAAALTLGRAWFARGRPDGGAPQWGTYQRWATTLSGILTTAGVHEFLGNLHGLYDAADLETAGWQRVLAYWHEQFGEAPHRVSELGLALSQAQDLDLPPSIASALGYAPDLATSRTRLAARIRAVQGRRFDESNLRIEHAGTDGHSKGVLWRVTRDNAQSSAATSDAATKDTWRSR